MTSRVSWVVSISTRNLFLIFLSQLILYTNSPITQNLFGMQRSARHFAKLKTTLCSSPVLRLSDMTQPFEIETDASQFAIGVVLKQGGHSVAYHSKTLAEDKVNYNTYDKEFYSLVHALK
jgi:hypothetical protein